MKKHTLREKLQYRFDNLMSKGTIALVGVLFGATAIVVIIVGVLLSILDQQHSSVGLNIWNSMMHIIDAGTITAADTGDVTFIILMSIVTLCGLFVTSILIGIITTGFEGKLMELKKGNSGVIEKNHTVILGFNSSISTLISELTIANENQKDGCIVILSEEDKETVETYIQQEVPDLKTTRVICRTGSITDSHMLGKCSLETCRSIIINEDKDFMTIKAILATNNYLNINCEEGKKPHIVATITTNENYSATEVISEGNTEVILVEDTISRIIAQTCRQPGLSNVLLELFDYDGDELYFETFPELEGKPFGEVLNEFEKAIVFGYKRGDKVYLNPDKSSVMEKDDECILLVEDDGCAKTKAYAKTDVEILKSNMETPDVPENILVIGINSMLEQIVVELDNYFCKGSNITVAHSNLKSVDQNISERLNNINLSFSECDTNNRVNLEKLTEGSVGHVLLLSDPKEDPETSDAITLLQLIHLRDISRKENKMMNITSEMKIVANQKLAEVTKANDLVVGSNIINLILTQISENRDLAIVFRELLQAEGSEIYIKKASNFVKLDTEMDFFEVTTVMEENDKIAIGYKKQKGNSFEMIVNPLKSEKVVFTEEDSIIYLSED